MKKIILILAIFPFTLLAQLPEKTLKKIDKANEDFEKGEYEKAEEVFKKITEEYPWSGYTWGRLAKTQRAIYFRQKQYDKLFEKKLSVTVTSNNGNKGNDSLANLLNDLLQEAKPYKKTYNNFINTCREGTRCSENAEMCSIYLRMDFIDEQTDPYVLDGAIYEYDLAEKAFTKNNLSDAIDHYTKAIAIDTTYFKARLYLGDAYYNNKEFLNAIKYFKQATKIDPKVQEGWKYLTDAYYNTQAYEEAFKTSIEGIIVYPDVGMFTKLEKSAKAIDKNFDRHWMKREVFPKMIASNLTRKLKDKDWQVYLDALNEILPYCNDKGIVIKTNTLTKQLYADVYAFEKMIKNSTDAKFAFAKQMELKGYLDCYVLFSLYHIDLNDQYQHFIKPNKNKLKDYIQLLCEL